MSAERQGFDTIIVGAGAAGCVLANRLSIDPARRVALVEAGPSDLGFPLSLKTTLPIGNIFLLPSPRTNWQHEFSGGPGVLNRSVPCPRGRLYGGSTSVNGTVYIRGHRLDYDEWAALGNPGWAWSDLLPFFRRHEDCDRARRAGAAAWHGTGGELSVQRPPESNPLAHAFVDAAAEAGYADIGAVSMLLDCVIAAGSRAGLPGLGVRSIRVVTLLPRGLTGVVHDLRQPPPVRQARAGPPPT